MTPDLAFHQTGAAFFGVASMLVAVVGGGALLLALLVLLQAAAPEFLGRATNSVRERPLVSLGIGAAVMAGLIALAALGKTVPAAGAFAVASFAGLTLFGLVATSENLGRRIAWISGREGTRLSHLALGWVVFLGAACVPYVGWLLVLPWGIASGLGGLVRAALPRRG